MRRQLSWISPLVMRLRRTFANLQAICSSSPRLMSVRQTNEKLLFLKLLYIFMRRQLSWIERSSTERKVRGSNPLRRTIFFITSFAQLDITFGDATSSNLRKLASNLLLFSSSNERSSTERKVRGSLLSEPDRKQVAPRLWLLTSATACSFNASPPCDAPISDNILIKNRKNLIFLPILIC